MCRSHSTIDAILQSQQTYGLCNLYYLLSLSYFFKKMFIWYAAFGEQHQQYNENFIQVFSQNKTSREIDTQM